MDIALRVSENDYKNILIALNRELCVAKNEGNTHNISCLERTIKAIEENAYQANIFDNV